MSKRPFVISKPDEDVYFYNLQQKTKRGITLQAHIADIHFGVMDPKTEYCILQEQFINVINGVPLDVISIDGDIFYKLMTGNSDAILYANLLFKSLVNKCTRDNTTLVIIAGTRQHDAGQLKIFYPYLNENNLDLRIVETIRFEYIKGMRILCIPELYGIDEDIYKQFLFYSGLYDMCFMHGTIKGAVYGDNVSQGRLFYIDDFCNCMGPIISGHVHTGGCFDKYFYYTGSPIRWSFGEESDKGFLFVLYDLDTRYHYTYLQKIQSFRYDTVDINDIISGSPDEIISYINELKKSGIDYLRIKCLQSADTDKTIRILQDYYKTDFTIKFKLERLKKLNTGNITNDMIESYDKYSYIFNNSMSPYEILAMFINDNETDIIIDAKQIEDIMKED